MVVRSRIWFRKAPSACWRRSSVSIPTANPFVDFRHVVDSRRNAGLRIAIGIYRPDGDNAKIQNHVLQPDIARTGPRKRFGRECGCGRFGTTSEEVRSFAYRMETPDRAIDTSPDGDPIAKPLAVAEPDPELVLATKQERLTLVKLLRAAIPSMTRRERHILRRRFLGEKRASRNKIGRELDCQRSACDNLIRALDKLRAIAAVAQPAE